MSLIFSKDTMENEAVWLLGTFFQQAWDEKIQKRELWSLENLLDVQNEWFYDVVSKKLYVYGDPTGKKIKGKVQSYAFNIDACTNIKLEKLNFFSTTITSKASSNITVNNCLFSESIVLLLNT